MNGMTQDEYRARIKQIREERHAMEQAFLNRERQVHRDFAFSNNTINPGDIVKAHNGDIIQVNQVKFATPRTQDGVSMCVYVGLQLTKKLEPRVHPIELKVWQNNVTEVLKRAE